MGNWRLLWRCLNFAILFLGVQEEFISTMQTIISKKQAYKVKKEEGWYSEDEMKNELGWTQFGPRLVELEFIWSCQV